MSKAKLDNVVPMIHLLKTPQEVKEFNEVYLLIRENESFREHIKHSISNKQDLNKYDVAAYSLYMYLERLCSENGHY